MRERLRGIAPGWSRGIAFLALACLFAAGSAYGQSFAVGAGGVLLSDQGTLVDVNAFNRGGGFLFGEVVIDGSSLGHSANLQLRWTIFSLPGGEPNSPSLAGNSALMLASYRFREAWWQAGFFGGVGLYHFSPKDPEPGQVVVDPSENVVGFCGGIETVFQVSRRFDVRLELSGQFPRTQASHKIVSLGASVAYHF